MLTSLCSLRQSAQVMRHVHVLEPQRVPRDDEHHFRVQHFLPILAGLQWISWSIVEAFMNAYYILSRDLNPKQSTNVHLENENSNLPAFGQLTTTVTADPVSTQGDKPYQARLSGTNLIGLISSSNYCMAPKKKGYTETPHLHIVFVVADIFPHCLNLLIADAFHSSSVYEHQQLSQKAPNAESSK
ncbi:hypothetical protein K438DRAFT_1751049 [Mycena galopus ATCC 62051]|nr:hypothetical protein K438DRAFT_1751049 [Mycena galopus ATCC 62051]